MKSGFALEEFLGSEQARAVAGATEAERREVATRLNAALADVDATLAMLSADDVHGWLFHAVPERFEPGDPLLPHVAPMVRALAGFAEARPAARHDRRGAAGARARARARPLAPSPRPRRGAAGALRARRAEGRPQRSVPVRVREEVQEVSRGVVALRERGDPQDELGLARRCRRPGRAWTRLAASSARRTRARAPGARSGSRGRAGAPSGRRTRRVLDHVDVVRAHARRRVALDEPGVERRRVVADGRAPEVVVAL